MSEILLRDRPLIGDTGDLSLCVPGPGSGQSYLSFSTYV